MFIRTGELEFLLSHYKELQAVLQELETEAEAVLDEKEVDAIYGCVLKRNIDNMPPSGKISDRTAKTALNISKLSREQREAISEINDDALLVDSVIIKIDMAMRRLNGQYRAAVELKFIKGWTWKQVSEEMQVDILKAQTYCKKGLEKMISVTKTSLVEQLKLRTLLELIKNN